MRPSLSPQEYAARWRYVAFARRLMGKTLGVAVLFVVAAILCTRELGAQQIPLTLSPSAPSVPTRQPTAAPTLRSVSSPSPTPWPTLTPLPSMPHATIVGCPASGNPVAPARPTVDIESSFAGVLERYLNEGASIEALDGMLRDWAWIRDKSDVAERSYDGHMAWQADLTGDGRPETIAMAEYCSETCPCFGDLLIWQCREGQMELLFSASREITQTEGASSPYYQVLQIDDFNHDEYPEMLFRSSWQTMHANMVRLYAIEWDKAGFVQRIRGFPEMPDPHYAFSDWDVYAIPGWFGSSGAGAPREYYQRWYWGPQSLNMVFLAEFYGVPNARIQYLHDGDDALMKGNLVAAVSNYRQALDRTDLPPGNHDAAVLEALARFKLVVAYALTGDEAKLAATYQELLDGVSVGSDERVFVEMAQAFRDEYQVGNDAQSACAAATAVAAANLSGTVGSLDAGWGEFDGYANTRYKEPADLCRVP